MIKCKDCKFWDPEMPDIDGVEPGQGECHAKAPSVVKKWAVWPNSTGHDWCGEARLKDAPSRPNSSEKKPGEQTMTPTDTIQALIDSIPIITRRQP